MANLKRLLVALSVVAGVVQAEKPDKSNSEPIIPGAYIVEFKDGHNSDSFYSSLGEKKVKASERMKLDYSLFKGVSFQLGDDGSHENLETEIKKLPSVKKLWPVKLISLPDNEVKWTMPPAPNGNNSSLMKRAEKGNDTWSSHVMTQVDKLRAEGYTGNGIRLGIIDSGVDYKHPLLGGCFGKGCLFSYGTDLVGDAYTGTNKPQPDNDPYDSCQGHGTHVAGIIAAQQSDFGFSGASPGVELGIYRAVGCGGVAADDILIAAFNQAYEDGSDIITCSISGPSGWTEDPWAVAVSRIVEAGVPCTISAGNSGGSGLFYTSSAADGKGVTSVASVNDKGIPEVFLKGTFKVGDGPEKAYPLVRGEPKFPNITLPLYHIPSKKEGDGACDPLPDDTPDLSKYMVFVELGWCGDFNKGDHIAAKGGKYILGYSSTDDYTNNPYMKDSKGIEGVGAVSHKQGMEFLESLKAGKQVYVTVADPEASPHIIEIKPNEKTGGFLSFYTSWGPTWEVDLEPQVSAPGGNILSTYPLSKGGYAVLSGTSMSCPLMASVYALIAEARGTTDPKKLLNLISSTAQPNLFNDGNSVFDKLAPVPQQGASLVQAHKAAHMSTIVDVPSFSFNDTANFVGAVNFTIENTGKEEVTYSIGHVAAMTMYTFKKGSTKPSGFPNPIAEAWAKMDFSSSKVTIGAGGAAEITVTCTPPEGLEESQIPVYSGYITINGTNAESLSIPYLGAVGSLYSISTMFNVEETFLTHYNSSALPQSGGNETWTLKKPEKSTPSASGGTIGDYPAALITLNIGTSIMRVDIVAVGKTDVKTTKVLGLDIVGSVGMAPIEYTARKLNVLGFTGMTEEGDVLPAGKYKFMIRALRVFGDREKIDDYKVLEMLPFSIVYE